MRDVDGLSPHKKSRHVILPWLNNALAVFGRPHCHLPDTYLSHGDLSPTTQPDAVPSLTNQYGQSDGSRSHIAVISARSPRPPTASLLSGTTSVLTSLILECNIPATKAE